MKKIYPLLAIFVVAALFSSCVSTNKMSDSVPIQKPGAHYGQIVHQALEADITVDDSKKIKGSSESTYFLMFRIEGDNEYADGVDYGAAQTMSSSTSVLKTFFGFLNPLALINKIITTTEKRLAKQSLTNTVELSITSCFRACSFSKESVIKFKVL